eukprot:TRINITY_DN1809_c0_g1_i1.p1 TRINITY_DN1809_c0_g1~~TRINITY_DN1809_c0_g1_i1.p1  ORF type:complete len:713 (+),score=373.30 TRINITY_DN1809_c0_g1_i1:77-2215(+)
MENGDMILRGDTEMGLLDQMNMLDRKMNEIQNELQQQELKFKHLQDERGLLEQLHTINQMTSRKMNGDSGFGDGKMLPSRKLFLERLPDPNDFARVALETAQRNLEEGAEDAQQILDEVTQKEPISLLEEEIRHVLETTITDPKIDMRMDPVTRVFLGCVVVTCGSLDEAERALTNLTGRWLLPPATDHAVQIHYIDESTDPKVLVEGLGLDVTANELHTTLSHYGIVEDFDARDRKDRKGVESATVRFASIEDAYTAISVQHGQPLPPQVYDIEMMGPDPSVFISSLARQLNIEEEDIEVRYGPEPIEGSPDRYAINCCMSVVPPENVVGLVADALDDDARIVVVHPPPAISLRLPKKRTKIRPEDQEQLVKLDDKLKLEKEKTAALERELRQVLLPQLRAKREAAEKANSDLEAMRQATGWDERKQFSTHTQMDRENQINELLNELANLQVEQATLKSQNIKKTAMIEKLAKKLMRKDEIEEDLENLREQLRQKELEYQDRVENVKTLKRILNKKGKLTDNLMKADDTAQIKALESDKRVLQHEIERHVKSRRAAEKTIQAQHHRLTQLDNRINAIASALSELHNDDESAARYRPEAWVPGDATVSFADYNQLQETLQQCRQGLMSKDLEMLERDSNIEALEKKLEILRHAKSSNLTRANRDHKQLRAQFDMFMHFKDQQAAEAEAKKEELRAEMEDLDHKHKKISSSMN